MKRTGYLYEKICDYDNICLAIKNAYRKKKKKRGFCKKVFRNYEHYAHIVREMLVNHSFVPSIPTNQTRIEYGKVREIKVPKFFPDQIVHWAVMQVIEPHLARGMYRYCCGSVKHRGGEYAKRKIENVERRDKHIKYVFQADIKKFFPSVDTGILKTQLRRVLKDKKVLHLLDQIIDNGAVGLPIGYYPSQALSNFYLLQFDHYIKEKLRIRHYVRFADDIVCHDTNKRKLRKAIGFIKEFLLGCKLYLKRATM